MFGTFFVTIVFGYIVYYFGMIGMDLYAVEKGERDANVTTEVDISSAVAGYKPKDVRYLLDDDIESESSVFDNGASPTEAEQGGGGPEYVKSEYQNEFSVSSLSEMFKQESSTPSIFQGLNLSTF